MRNFVVSGSGQTIVLGGAQVDSSVAYPLAPGQTIDLPVSSKVLVSIQGTAGSGSELRTLGLS